MGKIKELNRRLYVSTMLVHITTVLLLPLLSRIALSQPLTTPSSLANRTNTNCFPTHWSSPWSKVGSVWYTLLQGPGTWHKMEQMCRSIEPGRSTLASIKTVYEQAHLTKIMKNSRLEAWLGGARLQKTGSSGTRTREDHLLTLNH